MKKSMALFVMGVLITTLTFAGGLDLHFGMGYHSSFKGTVPDTTNAAVANLGNMPLGSGVYAGVGYAFGDTRFFNFGVETAMNLDFSVKPFGVLKFGLQGKAYMKFRIVEPLTITAFGGVQANFFRDKPVSFIDLDGDGFEDVPKIFAANPVVGVRVAFHFLYAEYAVVMPDLTKKDIGCFNIARHELGIGWALLQ